MVFRRSFCKGQSPQECAACIGRHADEFGVRVGYGGDVSAWDASWGPAERCTFITQATQTIRAPTVHLAIIAAAMVVLTNGAVVE